MEVSSSVRKGTQKKAIPLKLQAECVKLNTTLVFDHCCLTKTFISSYMYKLILHSIDVVILNSFFKIPELKDSFGYFSDTYIFI